MSLIYNNTELKDIPGFSKYLCSKDGLIFRKEHTVMQKSKKHHSDGHQSVNKIVKTFRQCNPTLNKKTGYMQCCVIGDNDKLVTLYVHRAVGLTWLHKPDFCDQIDHLDANKSNNNSINLEWVTRSENMRRVFERRVSRECGGK